jgi:prepilin-type N-terminal cleavage/methylation domain-containing protein
MNNKSNKNGFTLLEILVAMAIIVLIVSMVYGSYFATSKSAQACNTRIANSQQGRKLLEKVARMPITPKTAHIL